MNVSLENENKENKLKNIIHSSSQILLQINKIDEILSINSNDNKQLRDSWAQLCTNNNISVEFITVCGVIFNKLSEIDIEKTNNQSYSLLSIERLNYIDNELQLITSYLGTYVNNPNVQNFQYITNSISPINNIKKIVYEGWFFNIIDISYELSQKKELDNNISEFKKLITENTELVNDKKY